MKRDCLIRILQKRINMIQHVWRQRQRQMDRQTARQIRNRTKWEGNKRERKVEGKREGNKGKQLKDEMEREQKTEWFSQIDKHDPRGCQDKNLKSRCIAQKFREDLMLQFLLSSGGWDRSSVLQVGGRRASCRRPKSSL